MGVRSSSPTSWSEATATCGPGISRVPKPTRRCGDSPSIGGSYPLWSPDGHIVFSSSREGAGNIYRRAGDSNGGENRLTRGPNSQRPLAVSADGRHLIFEENTTDTAWNLMRLTLDGVSSPGALLRTPGSTSGTPRLSPDGRVDGLRLERDRRDGGLRTAVPGREPRGVSGVASGGRSPVWSPAGGELFFVNGTTCTGGVQLAPTFRYGAPLACSTSHR